MSRNPAPLPLYRPSDIDVLVAVLVPIAVLAEERGRIRNGATWLYRMFSPPIPASQRRA